VVSGEIEQTACRIESVEEPKIPRLQGTHAYFQNKSGKTSLFLLKKNMERSYSYSPTAHIVFWPFGECLCSSNFERDIVDTLCHASRRSNTTRPNKAGFLLHEGRVRRVGRHEATIQSHLSL